MQRAFEHLDRDRAAVRRAEQAVDDLRRAAPPVAGVTQLRQRTAVALEVGGGDVVEHERAALQVPAGECPLDPPLPSEQPVERRVQLVLVRVLDAELRRERRLRKGARHRQLRAGAEQPLHEHRQAERPLARRRPVEQAGELEPRCHQKRRLDVPRRQRTLDPKRLPGSHGTAGRAARRGSAAITSSGRCERLATVSFLTLPPSR